MRRALRTLRILALLTAFHSTAALLIAALFTLDAAVAVHRGTWIPSIGLIRLTVFVTLLATALLGATPSSRKHVAAPASERGDCDLEQELRQCVARLCTQTGRPIPDTIRVVSGSQARIGQDARRLWLHPGPRTLTIGRDLLVPGRAEVLVHEIVRELYLAGPDPTVPLAALLTRSRRALSWQLQQQAPPAERATWRFATWLRRRHARTYLRASDTLEAELLHAADATAKRITQNPSVWADTKT